MKASQVMSQPAGINLPASQDPYWLRHTAMQFAVQWMQGQDGHLVDVAEGIEKYLRGEDE